MANAILQDRDGNNSSKRIVGSILVLVGLLEKMYLFYLGSKATTLLVNFVNLDTSANSLLIAGASLLGISVLEFLSPKAKDTTTSNITKDKEEELA